MIYPVIQSNMTDAYNAEIRKFYWQTKICLNTSLIYFTDKSKNIFLVISNFVMNLNCSEKCEKFIL